jgi:hypothetical protein
LIVILAYEDRVPMSLRFNAAKLTSGRYLVLHMLCQVVYVLDLSHSQHKAGGSGGTELAQSLNQSGFVACDRQAEEHSTRATSDPGSRSRKSNTTTNNNNNDPYLLEGVTDLAREAQAAAVFLGQARRERISLSLETRGAVVTPVLTQAVTHLLVTPQGEHRSVRNVTRC